MEDSYQIAQDLYNYIKDDIDHRENDKRKTIDFLIMKLENFKNNM